MSASGPSRNRSPSADPACSQTEHNLLTHRSLVAAVESRRVPEELLAPGFHMENHTAAALDYTYRGPSGWREWMSDLFEAFADGARYEMRELIAARDDLVVAAFTVVGASVWSNNQLQFSWVGVTWLRDGQATRAVGVTSRADALAASEQHSPQAGSAHASGPPRGAP